MLEMGNLRPETNHFFLHFLAYISLVASHPLLSQPRLSEVEWANYNYHEPQGPGTYAFGYDIEDPLTNNIQFRDEERYPNGTVVGSYGYVKPDGNIHIVKYTADEKGYRATIENPRGQPKVYEEPQQSNPNERQPSPILLTAMNSQKVYKQQTVHEQRLRPIDDIVSRNSFYDTRRNDLQQNWLFGEDSNYAVEPKKFYIRRK
nr:uncharacterized protein LOC111502249 [Leptinotarsa decemlineata]